METFIIYYKLENQFKVRMKKYKNKINNYLIQNQKGLVKNIQYLLTNMLRTDFSYKGLTTTDNFQKHLIGISMDRHIWTTQLYLVLEENFWLML